MSYARQELRRHLARLFGCPPEQARIEQLARALDSAPRDGDLIMVTCSALLRSKRLPVLFKTGRRRVFTRDGA